MFLLNAKTHKYRDFFRDMKVKICQKNKAFPIGSSSELREIKQS